MNENNFYNQILNKDIVGLIDDNLGIDRTTGLANDDVDKVSSGIDNSLSLVRAIQFAQVNLRTGEAKTNEKFKEFIAEKLTHPTNNDSALMLIIGRDGAGKTLLGHCLSSLFEKEKIVKINVEDNPNASPAKLHSLFSSETEGYRKLTRIKRTTLCSAVHYSLDMGIAIPLFSFVDFKPLLLNKLPSAENDLISNKLTKNKYTIENVPLREGVFQAFIAEQLKIKLSSDTDLHIQQWHVSSMLMSVSVLTNDQVFDFNTITLDNINIDEMRGPIKQKDLFRLSKKALKTINSQFIDQYSDLKKVIHTYCSSSFNAIPEDELGKLIKTEMLSFLQDKHCSKDLRDIILSSESSINDTILDCAEGLVHGELIKIETMKLFGSRIDGESKATVIVSDVTYERNAIKALYLQRDYKRLYNADQVALVNLIVDAIVSLTPLSTFAPLSVQLLAQDWMNNDSKIKQHYEAVIEKLNRQFGLSLQSDALIYEELENDLVGVKKLEALLSVMLMEYYAKLKNDIAMQTYIEELKPLLTDKIFVIDSLTFMIYFSTWVNNISPLIKLLAMMDVESIVKKYEFMEIICLGHFANELQQDSVPLTGGLTSSYQNLLRNINFLAGITQTKIIAFLNPAHMEKNISMLANAYNIVHRGTYFAWNELQTNPEATTNSFFIGQISSFKHSNEGPRLFEAVTDQNVLPIYSEQLRQSCEVKVDFDDNLN